MRTQTPPVQDQKKTESPYFDFEFSLPKKLENKVTNTAKPRFLMWGTVKSEDCPA